MFSDISRKHDQAYLKLLGLGEHKKIKLVVMKSVQTKGLERTKIPCSANVNEEKLDENISRAKNKIFEYAFCNEWDYFVTLTISPERFDRFDLKSFFKTFSQWMQNQRKRFPDFRYLLVPEEHKDGAWHFHGFVFGLPESEVQQFRIGDKMSSYMASKVKKGEALFNWFSYAKKFGFCDLEKIRNAEAVSKYITKYINKSLFESKKRVGCNLYYCSKGLKTAEKIAEGMWLCPDFNFQFSNEYCSISTFDFQSALVADLKSRISNVDYSRVRDKALIPRIFTQWRNLDSPLECLLE